MSFIQSLSLLNFRSYDSARLENIKPGLIVLTGPNGAGKTNILEAVSLLAPGRGLRGASAEELQRRDSIEGWTIAASIDTGGAQAAIGTGIDSVTLKRLVRINGVSMKSQAALADYMTCLWLTPQMDRIFIDSAGGRRRFFDKLVFAFDPSHAGRVTRYENALAQRSRLLKENKADPSWLSSLELQMAEAGIAIAAARIDVSARLQRACHAATQDEAVFFPKARLRLSGAIEELLMTSPAIEVEELFLYQLRQSRGRDAETGGAATGPHKSDLLVDYEEKDMPADQCSTGEQKALLIGIILAHARLLLGERGAVPVLLMDEIAAHLDEKRRAALFDLFGTLGGQVWMTGTDKSLFSSVENSAQFFSVDHGKVTPSSR